MKKLIVSNDILIRGADAVLINAIESELTIPNQQYFLLENMGKNVKYIPKEYIAFKRTGNDYSIPFGAISSPRIRRHLTGFKYEIVPYNTHKVYLESTVPLYDFQEKALKELTKQHRGVLVAETGGGKTNIGLNIVRELGQRTLWITHTTDLLFQSRDRAKEIFKNVDIGYITDGKVEIGADITFATVQTLHKVVDQVKNEFNIVIVDEAHNCVGSPTLATMFYKAVNSLYAQYKYGLTATPKRTDGLERMVFALLGQVTYEIPKGEIEKVVVPFEYEHINNDKKYDVADYTTDGMINATKIAQLLYHDNKRNDLIVDTATKTNSKGTIILCRYIKQAEYINEKLNELGKKTALLIGRVTKKQRQEILNSDELEVIVATTSLAKEGLDIPRYDTLILAYSVTNRHEFRQVVGRVRRAFEGKKRAIVYEVIDNDIEHLRKRGKLHNTWTKRMNS